MMQVSSFGEKADPNNQGDSSEVIIVEHLHHGVRTILEINFSSLIDIRIGPN